ncbi:YggS family pyridoxal phosphate enzyme [Vibrio sp. 10N.286.49.B3]|uniref:YggS family pyridoxal phosphate-dependent enzyme n=1 Tax=Vibrio sp. 10N.286.49.B3 TaxID=1880855 RepID=UPI000C83F3C0|nr:YggS family pyridoxal phosphate-dependent enzyme [Vibrio sp. 10N.286.49.B3]PMH43732.1 YggS family pyridoxal phosphate enzyme [Vibrio sp. 10N.286.49.B3]
MSSIQQNIQQITSQIAECEIKYQRTPQSVELLAVSKTKPNEAVLEAALAGQTSFGENYVQEGVNKVQYFTQHHSDLNLVWHFIGPIQSNKTKPIAEHFHWVHSIERAKIAQRLNDQRPADLDPLQVLIQVNTSGENSKSGIDTGEVMALAAMIDDLPNLSLRGLMSIPANVTDHQQQLEAFQSLAQLQQQLTARYPSVDTLSMGMSGDMAAAIEAGSSMVRIGTAIFGSRN